MLFRSIAIFACALSIVAHAAASPTKRDDLVHVGVEIENIFNNVTVNVLDQRDDKVDARDVLNLLSQKREEEDDGLVSIDIDVNNLLNNASISVINQ